MIRHALKGLSGPLGLAAPLLAFGALLLSLPAAADPPSYIVREGDTLPSLASAFYGEEWKAVYFGEREALPAPGEPLVVPVVSTIRAQEGDTWERLAKIHLGDSRRSSLLAQFNEREPDAPLSEGQALVVPWVVRHKVAPGDTLAKIARRYYRNPKMAGLLRRYNLLSRARIPRRLQVIFVPILDPEAAEAAVRPRVEALSPPGQAEEGEAAAPPAEAPEATEVALEISDGGTPIEDTGDVAPTLSEETLSQAEALAPDPHAPLDEGAFEALLTEARAAYMRGEYQQAVLSLKLTAARAGGVSEGRRAQLYRLMGSGYIALGQREEGLRAYRRMLVLDPSMRFDPVLTSPKLIEALEEARRSPTRR